MFNADWLPHAAMRTWVTAERNAAIKRCLMLKGLADNIFLWSLSAYTGYGVCHCIIRLVKGLEL